MSDSYQAIYDAVRSRISNGDVGRAVTEAMRSAFDISHVVVRAQEQVYAISHDLRRPSVLYRPTVVPDGTKWCALYGENLMEGVSGFGDTPQEAMADFDKAWIEQLTPEAQHIQNAIDEEDAREEVMNNGPFGVGA